MKHFSKLTAALVVLGLLAGCGEGAAPAASTASTAPTSIQDSTAASEPESSAEPAEIQETSMVEEPLGEAADTSGLFTERDSRVDYDAAECIQITLSGASAQCDSTAVTIDGSTVTITAEGTYLLSGDLEGMVIVDAGDSGKVQLILDGVQITSPTSAAIYVREADKVFVTTAEGSENTLANGGEYIAIDDNNIDGAIFSKCDLTLNGQGSLTVDAPQGHGIVTKDDLAITSGSYTISAESHGLSGKDSVRISGGTFAITSGKDGIHSENLDDPEEGFVYLSGGTFAITASGDGISASGYLQAEGGEFAITAGGGSANAAAAWSTDDSASLKGLKSSGDMLLNDGTFQIDSADDGLHSNANLSLTGGSYTISAGDDGAHADANLTISGGTVDILQSYEGIEGKSIDIAGGEIHLVSSDDGLNAAGGNDQSGTGGFAPMDNFAASADTYLHISGGTLYVNAEGDGLDSNGSLMISGGTTYVEGPTMSGNGSLDFNGTGTISGGVLLALGGGQMEQNFSAAENQGAMLVSVGAQAAGTTLELTDSDGNILLSYTPEKSYGSVIISLPEILQGGTYTLTAGGTSAEITMDSLLYGAGGGFGGIGGGRGGFGG